MCIKGILWIVIILLFAAIIGLIIYKVQKYSWFGFILMNYIFVSFYAYSFNI